MPSNNDTGELLTAAERGEADTVKRLLRTGVNPNPTDGGWGALTVAAYHGRVSVVRLVLEHGELPDRRENGIPVLALAANRGRLGAVRELITAGADVNARSHHNGWTALHYAVAPDWTGDDRGFIGIARTLVKAGADPDAMDARGNTPLMHLRCDDYRMGVLLIGAGAQVNARNQDGWTPLLHALATGRTTNAEYLISKGADITDPEIQARAWRILGNSQYWRILQLVQVLRRLGFETNPESAKGMLANLEEFRSALLHYLNEAN